MDDQKIIRLFWVRSEEAIRAVDRKYGRYCYAIAHNILKNAEDAEECVSDTWLRAWNAIPPQKPQRLQTFLGRITRNLSLNRYEKRHAKKRGGEYELVLDELAECLPGNAQTQEDLAFKDLLDRFLDTLSPQECKLFVRRYWYLDAVKELAQKYRMTETNVTVTLYRTREKLLAYLEKEGVTP